MKRTLFILKNKFLLTTFSLLIILFAFEETNIFNLLHMKSNLKIAEKKNAAQERKIKTIRFKIKELTTNPKALEKFARETYFMKKKNEIVILFVEKDSTLN